MKIHKNGNVFHKLNGYYHREDGPAVVVDGSKYWYINGQYHREDGPAIEWASGTKFWYINGKELTEEEFNKRPIRTVDAYGTIHYKVNGQYHREDGPACEYTNGDKHWCINGKRHREDGAAIELANGGKQWWLNNKQLTEEEFNTIYHKLNGEYHREDGSAIELANGTKKWYKHGRLYREDGPAVEYIDGSKEWWIELTRKEFELQSINKNQLIELIKIERNKNKYLFFIASVSLATMIFASLILAKWLF